MPWPHFLVLKILFSDDLKRSIGQNMVPENSFSEDLPLNILKIKLSREPNTVRRMNDILTSLFSLAKRWLKTHDPR